ncbi:hypothetical protein HOC35_05025 [Candidatus Woesearchaeota archaeon]|jgi:hypothetical protein|nr:hypothetical protein [Candidatus Woesearchaeota archaeon]
MKNNRLWVQNKDTLELRQATKSFEADLSVINLAFDFDGVITSPQGYKASILSEMGYDINPEDTANKFALKKMGQQRPELSAKEIKRDYNEMIDLLYVDRILDIPAEVGAIEVMKKYCENERYNVYIVTSRYANSERPQVQAAGKWLQKKGISIDGLIHTDEQNKQQDLAKMRPAIYVDDSIKKLYELFEDQECTMLPGEIADTKIIHFRQVANAHESVRGKILQVNSWYTIDKLVREG